MRLYWYLLTLAYETCINDGIYYHLFGFLKLFSIFVGRFQQY